MKQNFHSVALIFLLAFLISTQYSFARNLSSKEGEVDEKITNISNKESAENIGNINYFDNLMGLEECQNEDEECLKRRVIAEAHLDYIYTQHHKP
ncbi:hypothetical protein DH2020_021062 [Rehmannia glutinosa]|uniref:Phytosulfokine n=1 Tax=Rehmannia glutinosa TaxID=99300 RepID=A0ABR0W9A9_REHGL